MPARVALETIVPIVPPGKQAKGGVTKLVLKFVTPLLHLQILDYWEECSPLYSEVTE